MKDKIRRLTLAVVGLMAMLCLASAGCQKGNQGGETVPSPPRELIEKSYQAGGAPMARPGNTSTSGKPNTPR